MERAFISGRGLISPIGGTVAENEAGLRSGKSGIIQEPSFVEHKLESIVGGSAGPVPSCSLIDRKTLRFCPPVGVMSVVAVLEALNEAGIGLDELRNMRVAVIGAVALVCIGVIGLGVVESREDDELRQARQAASNYKYAKSWLAICLPVAYCLLDAAGTFADSLVLERLNEDSANVAYELTFLAAGIGCLVYLLVRREKFTFKAELPKYVGAACETVGQLFYIYALADEEHVMMSAPIISAYCVASVLWSRLFLKEKLSWKHYLMIGLVVAGIVILGIYDI